MDMTIKMIIDMTRDGDSGQHCADGDLLCRVHAPACWRVALLLATSPALQLESFNTQPQNYWCGHEERLS
jgi:hypothetical protein